MSKYTGMDRDELQDNVDRALEAIRHLHEAEAYISGSSIEYQNTILDEITDAVNDIADELPDMQDALLEANKAEEEAERREYYRSVI